jgi:general secretion pathway protein D
VGQEVPFLTGSFSNTGSGTGTGSGVNPFQTIERLPGSTQPVLME